MTTKKFSKNARTVLEKRYLKTDGNGNPVEKPDDMFRRVADNIALADAYYSATPREVVKTADSFFDVLSNLKFLSGTPLRNAGRRLQQLSACFVLPLNDSLESIYETLKNSALVFRSGGAVGISFSRLRPRGSYISSTGGKSSGPVSFMDLYNASTEVINEACVRYGATMGVLRIDHPDILEFVNSKKEEGRLNNFNLSVSVPDYFMDSLQKGETIQLRDSHTGEAVAEENSTELFEELCNAAWESAEPGLLFIDEINRDNPTPKAGRIEAVNLCGEQPLLPYESCNLGSVVLPNIADKEGNIDWDGLREVVFTAVHFLDNTIDVNHYVIPEIEDATKENRKIGLGLMGFSDVLVRRKVAYDSEEARVFAEKIMKFVTESAREASRELAKKRGPFPHYSESVWAKKGEPIRNAAVTTLAPNGTTSLLADCTGGIEPIFALAYKRKHMKTLKGEELFYVHPEFERVAKEKGFYSESLIEKVAQRGSCKGMEDVPEEVQDVFVTAHDVRPEDHVRMQAAFQKYTDNAVSKTVNLATDASVEDVKRIFKLAYELNCKGITVYRDKSRKKQVLNAGD